MTFSLAHVDRDVALQRPFEGADLGSLPTGELLRLLEAASAGKLSQDLALATVAAEVARRSTPDDGAAGIARRQGFGSAGELVADRLGSAMGEGHKLVHAGTAMAAGGALGKGLSEGSLSVDKAELIGQAVARLSGDTAELEAKLTSLGQNLSYKQLRLTVPRRVAEHDREDFAARQERQRHERTLDFKEDTSGMTEVRGQLDPISASFIKSWVDAQVKEAFQAKREDDSDDRTAGQIRVDALVALCQHGLDCESPASGVKSQVIVRMSLEDMEDDLALVTCDALQGPITARTARALLVDAAVLPVVMGANSVVLDMGRSQRLFTPYQRMAIAERDGGCAKCHAPISWCATHHIVYWRNEGPTDLQNGVLLCTRCHNQVHHDRWDIDVDQDNRVWFIPPAEVDPHRRRRLGGLAALAER